MIMKEASHLLLDTPEDYVTEPTDIDRLLVCFAQFGAEGVTKQYVSERRALVCALEILFPKPIRDQLLPFYETGKISAADIAKAARIPVHYVREAMGDAYRDHIDECHERIAAE